MAMASWNAVAGLLPSARPDRDPRMIARRTEPVAGVTIVTARVHRHP
jgi:hypothetical protein